MTRPRFALAAACLACVAAIAACGGGTTTSPSSSKSVPVLHYRPHAQPLDVTITPGTASRYVRQEYVTYSSVDGQRVPAVFTIPTALNPLGCLIYQGPISQSKLQNPDIAESAALLHLATFTIDPRNAGARGSEAATDAALAAPATFVQMLADTVVDLRVALDWLEQQPQCNHQVAFMGTAFGGIVGVNLAAQDTRIKAAILTSIPATFEEAALVGYLNLQADPGINVIVPGAATSTSEMSTLNDLLGPYEPVNVIGEIAPRPLLLIEGRNDPMLAPIGAMQLAAAAGEPKTVIFANTGGNPFGHSTAQKAISVQVLTFLEENLDLPLPT